MRACIYYHPEAYTISGQKLMGRNAAGASFLRAMLQYSRADEFWVQAENKTHAHHFASVFKEFGRSEAVKAVYRHNLSALGDAGVAYYPGPGIGQHAWQRAAYGHAAWSLCGITHTTSSARAMDAITDLITAPVKPWDAVICTSNAVKEHVSKILQAQVDYLSERLGISRLVLPQLPVIPLGIHSADFAFTADQKQAARQKLGLETDTMAVLFMGRLSFHAKAHPLAMYQALEIAAAKTGKKITLIECGWHANGAIANAFAEAAIQACPSVRVITLDGRSPENRDMAWASADVFCSLSDNIQETFGIVPIEAMAAGLPVVVSDWDGYKDTVRDGVDGYRIPTIMPQAGLGADLAIRHALEIDTYDMYCGYTCSVVSVDIEETARALITLFESPSLRLKMGQAGRQRVKEVFDWSAIIPRYEELWSQLNEIRASESSKLPNLLNPWPARMDPFRAFANYPTHQLTLETVVDLVEPDPEAMIKRALALRQLMMVSFADFVLPTADEVKKILSAVPFPKTVAEVVSTFEKSRQPFIFRGIVSLLKLGVLKLI